MTLAHIAAALGLALAYRWLLPARWRGWALLVASVALVYWLSPASPIRYVDFLLPGLTLLLTVVTWWVTRPADFSLTPDDRRTLVVLGGLVIALAELRYLLSGWGAASATPDPVLAAGMVGLATGGLALGERRAGDRARSQMAVLVLIIGLFVVLKSAPLATAAAAGQRGLLGQPAALAAPGDLAWLGFSYVAFRLLHLIFDRRAGRLPAVSLRETLVYVLFFPAFLSGPIDRVERFVKDYRGLEALPLPETARLLDGGERILGGLLKKFVIADTLAPFTLGAITAEQFNSPAGGWALLYLYGIRLFLDFSGYTDIAIGVGILLGVRLPENFDRPYLKTSLAAFWQSWHMTLSNWARYYVFSPLSRAMLKREPRPSPLVSVFVAQLATMGVIGLWHGIAWPFVAWGLWHGLGLFVHKWWSDRTRRVYLSLRDRPRLKALWNGAAWLLTLQFVMLGWVWFALPRIDQAADVFLKLFGIGW